MAAPSWMANSSLRPEVIRGYREAPPNMVAEVLGGELLFRGDGEVRAEPFDAIALELAALWRP